MLSVAPSLRHSVAPSERPLALELEGVTKTFGGRVAAGIGRTYQITNLFPALTVADNVRLAAQGLSPGKFQMLRPVPRRGPLQERVEQALAAVGMLDRAD